MLNKLLLISVALLSDICLGGVELVSLSESGTITDPVVGAKRPVMIQLWASWCSSCGELMAEMIEIKDAPWTYKAISVDETVDLAKEYFKKKPLLAKVLNSAYWDKDNNLATKMKVNVLPTLILVDALGKELARISGHPTKSELEQLKAKAK